MIEGIAIWLKKSTTYQYWLNTGENATQKDNCFLHMLFMRVATIILSINRDV